MVASLLLLAQILFSCGSESTGSASPASPGIANPAPSPTGSLVCTQVYVYGIMIRVTDGDGNPIINAHAVIQDGTYSETLEPVTEPSETGIYQGAGERPGTYQLTVSAPGYLPKTYDHLVVQAGTCHVTPVTLQVSLIPY
jgi:hypothetical protein